MRPNGGQLFGVLLGKQFVENLELFSGAVCRQCFKSVFSTAKAAFAFIYFVTVVPKDFAFKTQN